MRLEEESIRERNVKEMVEFTPPSLKVMVSNPYFLLFISVLALTSCTGNETTIRIIQMGG